MANLVIRVPMKAEDLCDLEAKRNPCVGVRTAEHQDKRVREDAGIQQRGRGKRLKVPQRIGNAMITGATSSTHVARS